MQNTWLYIDSPSIYGGQAQVDSVGEWHIRECQLIHVAVKG